MHIVYMATNPVNNKIYVGMSSRPLEARLYSHDIAANNGSNLRFHMALRKYGGTKNFKIDILFQSEDLMCVRNEEARLIVEKRSMNFEVGYNARAGGCGGWIVPPEKYDSWKSKNVALVKGHRNGNAIHTTDDEFVSAAVAYLNTINETQHVPRSGWSAAIGLPACAPGQFRFAGLGFQGFLARVSDASGLPLAPMYFKSDTHRRALAAANRGFYWINDGVTSKQHKGDLLPAGFVKGRIINGNR